MSYTGDPKPTAPYYKWTLDWVTSHTLKNVLASRSAAPATDKALAQGVAEKLHSARGTLMAVVKSHTRIMPLGMDLSALPVVVYLTQDEYSLVRQTLGSIGTFDRRPRKQEEGS